jgi:hypothetical protein
VAAPAARSGRGLTRRLADEEGAAQVVQLVLLMPLLALLLALVLHLGLFLTTRQAVITATAEGLKEATLYGASPTVDGERRARQVLADHSTATGVTIQTSVDDLAGTVTLTIHADAPSIAPGLPRTIRHTATGTHERWLP